jgi:hypothetical protein
MSKKSNQPKSDLIEVLKEATNGLLNEDSLTTIETAFNEEVEQRASLREQAALTRQDQEYSEKLVKVLEAIDRDRTRKLKTVVEAIDKSNTQKLKKVINKYQRALHEDADGFKNKIVKNISDYLDLYIEESIPQTAINEAVKNKKALTVLANLRNQLSIGSSLLDESVRAAVIDGKNKMNELQAQVDKVTKENALLRENYKSVSANLLLEQKSAGLPSKKKEYLKKVLANKTPEFIKENFEYTLNLFEKKENQQLDNIREEAMKSRKVNIPGRSIDQLINEHTEDVVERREHSERPMPHTSAPIINNYMEQLKKYK